MNVDLGAGSKKLVEKSGIFKSEEQKSKQITEECSHWGLEERVSENNTEEWP